MGEPVRVETSCPRCGLGGLHDEPWTFAVKPNSLTAARLRLADAAEALEACAPHESLARYESYAAAFFQLAALRTKRAGG